MFIFPSRTARRFKDTVHVLLILQIFLVPDRRITCWLHYLPHLIDNFVSVWTDSCIFASLCVFEFECAWMFHSCVPFICNLSTPVCSHRLSWTTMDCHPNESVPLTWCAKAIQVPIFLVAQIHVYFTHPHRIHTTQFRCYRPVTLTEAKTHLYTSTEALRLFS